MVDDLKPSNMATTVIKKENLTNFNKKKLKNPEKGQLFQTSGWYICDYLSELWLITENRTFLPKNAKLIKKNHVKCKLLPNFREIIQLWSSLSIMVNDSNFHQRWSALLLKIESLTKKINKNILKNSVKCQFLANFEFGWSLFTFDDLACSTFKMAINNRNAVVFGMKQHCDMKIQFCTSEGPVVYWIQLLGDQNLIGNKIFFTRWAIQAHVSLWFYIT